MSVLGSKLSSGRLEGVPVSAQQAVIANSRKTANQSVAIGDHAASNEQVRLLFGCERWFLVLHGTRKNPLPFDNRHTSATSRGSRSNDWMLIDATGSATIVDQGFGHFSFR
jgi:hypothetical protein